jgi:hypothetical protein
MIRDAELNLPDVLAEVSTAFERYETALRQNDVAALNDFFLVSPRTVRYGTGDEQYGYDSIKVWRQRAQPVHPARVIQRSVITSFGRDSASIAAEFTAPGSPVVGRQTQQWVRSERGWKIALAHVSLPR